MHPVLDREVSGAGPGYERKTDVIFFLGKQTIMLLLHPLLYLICFICFHYKQGCKQFAGHKLKDLSLSSDCFENPASFANEKYGSVFSCPLYEAP